MRGYRSSMECRDSVMHLYRCIAAWRNRSRATPCSFCQGGERRDEVIENAANPPSPPGLLPPAPGLMPGQFACLGHRLESLLPLLEERSPQMVGLAFFFLRSARNVIMVFARSTCSQLDQPCLDGLRLGDGFKRDCGLTAKCGGQLS